MNQSLPAGVPPVPAPWTLTGQGYVFVVRLPHEVLQQGSFLPAGCPRLGRSRLAFAMFVDYASSDVGPYRELLYIPGRLGIGGRRDLSISRIFVSTWASVVNGRSNWGIPKDRADFDFTAGPDGVDRVTVAAPDGTIFAELELQARGPRLPVPAHWVPRPLRTLSQWYDGRVYIYAPSARGHVRLARVLRWRFDARYFPDLARGEPVLALNVTDFRMVFPVARIEAARV